MFPAHRGAVRTVSFFGRDGGVRGAARRKIFFGAAAENGDGPGSVS